MTSLLSKLYVVGSFTTDPIIEVLRFWSEKFELGTRLEAAPYGQLFQQLLDPASGLRSNRAGATLVFARWRDLVAAGTAGTAPAAYDAAAHELAAALASFAHGLPCLVVIAPQAEDRAAAAAATERLQQLVGGTARLFVIKGEAAFARYRVGDPYDPVADRSGHVPYRDDAMAALATTAMRWYAALVRKPVKVVAADCDNTLWAGVVGEDGRAGLRIEDGHIALQRRLVEQGELGRLVCLVSKNEERDVIDVLENRPEMALKRDNVLALAVNWQPKPANIEKLAADFDFSTDSVLFLDDNPVECEAMRRQCPSVLTVRSPEDHRRLGEFAEHLWLFDQPRVTDEDRQRVQMYRDNVARLDLKRAAQDIEGFIAGLQLEIDIAVAGTADVTRLAQLTQRTNQFNCSLVRCDEESLRQQLADPAVHLLTVRVRDRFGDYGLVGMMRGREQASALVVDLFMLSCRALGRGVEHRMANHLGLLAERRRLAEVAIEFVGGERNTPARQFVEDLVGSSVVADGRHPVGSGAARDFRFATASLARRAEAVGNAPAGDASSMRPAALARTDWGRLYEDIAWNFDTAAKIVAAMTERRQRPNLATGYVAAAAGLERQIAEIWSSVLGVSPVGVNDRFQDLGGRSLHVVRIHSRLVGQLGLSVELSELFQHATVSILASHLSSKGGTGNVVLQRASDRAILMRQAQARATSRFKEKQ